MQSRALVLLTLVVVLVLLPSSTGMATPSSSAATPNPSSQKSTGDMQFSRFLIPSSHIFYRTPLSAAFVNLRPIVPGHVLVMPERIVATMAELNQDEYLDLWASVRVVQAVLKKHYQGTTAFNVAVQDGKAAGQSVPHVHVHILPRKNPGEDAFERNDDVYDALEAWAPTNADGDRKAPTNIEVPDDADRVDRTVETMAEEAGWYRSLLQEESQD